MRIQILEDESKSYRIGSEASVVDASPVGDFRKDTRGVLLSREDTLKYFTQTAQGKVLGELGNNCGNISRIVLCRRVKLKQAELDPVLDELEQKGKIKRTKLRNGRRGPPQELIILKE